MNQAFITALVTGMHTVDVFDNNTRSVIRRDDDMHTCIMCLCIMTSTRSVVATVVYYE